MGQLLGSCFCVLIITCITAILDICNSKYLLLILLVEISLRQNFDELRSHMALDLSCAFLLQFLRNSYNFNCCSNISDLLHEVNAERERS